jgi:lysophospholipase L1-like esterase
MAIQFRRGNQADLDPTKLMAGEPAAALDTHKIFVGLGNGRVFESGDMFSDDFANGNVSNPNTVDVALAAKEAQPGSSLETSINGITNRINVLSSYDLSNVLIVGDSYTVGTGATTPTTDNWAQQWVNIAHPLQYSIHGYGGNGFIRPGTDGHTLLQDITLLATSQTQVYRNSVSLFILQGGINDQFQSGTYSTIDTAMTNTFNYVKAQYPNAKIVCLYYACPTPVYRFLYSNGVASLRKNGIVATFDARTWIYYNPTYDYSDNTHPTSAGHSHIAKMFQLFLQGCDTYESRELYLTSRLSANHKIHFQLRRDIVSLDISCADSFSLANLVWYDIVAHDEIPTWTASEANTIFPVYLAPMSYGIGIGWNGAPGSLKISLVNYSGAPATPGAQTLVAQLLGRVYMQPDT